MQSIFRRKAETYVERPDLAAGILSDPANPLNQITQVITQGNVLDVGCGTGILGRLLAGRSGVVVDGVDPAVSATSPGVQFYRKFYPVMLEELFEQASFKHYDWFVLADVIEHFAYPDEMLSALVAQASPDARFVISTPNVAHISVRSELMKGRFEYEASGILESTHLRLMTRETLTKTLASAGLSTERLMMLNRQPEPQFFVERGYLRGLLSLAAMEEDASLFAYQFLAVAKKGVSASETTSEHVGSGSVRSCQKGVLRLAAWQLKQRLLGRQ